MLFSQSPIPGVWIVEPTPHQDNRGHFFRAWCSQEFTDHGIQFHPVQSNMGFSTQRGTIRGMHFQAEPALEAKLIRCTRGAMFDVAVDLRPDSPNYMQWFGIELSAQNGRMLYIPEGCAHGYQTLEDATEMHYMTSAVYTPSAAHGVRYNDAAFGIRWPLPPSAISDQDSNWPLLAGAIDPGVCGETSEDRFAGNNR